MVTTAIATVHLLVACTFTTVAGDWLPGLEVHAVYPSGPVCAAAVEGAREEQVYAVECMAHTPAAVKKKWESCLTWFMIITKPDAYGGY